MCYGSYVINVRTLILWWLRPHTPARDCRLWTLVKGLNKSSPEFLPLFSQKESGFQGSALRTQKEKEMFAHSLQMSSREPDRCNGLYVAFPAHPPDHATKQQHTKRQHKQRHRVNRQCFRGGQHQRTITLIEGLRDAGNRADEVLIIR